MKRQTSIQGVVSLWEPASLDISPFVFPGNFKLRKSGFINRHLQVCDQITIGSHSILLKTTVLGKITSIMRLPLSAFQGVALRISAFGSGDGLYYATSINLHHDKECFCVPLFLANDMDVTSARLQVWSRTLKMPILLPTPEGGWREPNEPPGRLIIKPPYQRSARQTLASRKAVLPSYRETCRIDLEKKVSGREISSWD